MVHNFDLFWLHIMQFPFYLPRGEGVLSRVATFAIIIYDHLNGS